MLALALLLAFLIAIAYLASVQGESASRKQTLKELANLFFFWPLDLLLYIYRKVVSLRSS